MTTDRVKFYRFPIPYPRWSPKHPARTLIVLLCLAVLIL